jgi:hydrogenase nickel incorporation protein HypA/HybF
VHELSIALAIAEAAAEQAEQNAGARITKVYLKLGQLAGVVKSALLASYELAAQLPEIAGSELIIDEIPITAFCTQCNAPRPVKSPQEICCVQCGSPTPEIMTGRELEVVAVEVIQ